MRFALIDLEGATLDSFASFEEAREGARDLLRSDPSLSDELLVIEYSEGQPAGSPRTAGEVAWPKVDPVLIAGLSQVPDPTVEVTPSSRDYSYDQAGLQSGRLSDLAEKSIAHGGAIRLHRHRAGR